MLGEDLSSTAMSPHARCLDGSNKFCDGTVISPERKNPKKQRVAAAHSMIISVQIPIDVIFQWLCN